MFWEEKYEQLWINRSPQVTTSFSGRVTVTVEPRCQLEYIFIICNQEVMKQSVGYL